MPMTHDLAALAMRLPRSAAVAGSTSGSPPARPSPNGAVAASVILGAILLAFVVGALVIARSARRSRNQHRDPDA